MHDRHVRYPNDPGPMWPGMPHVRFTLAERGDPDLVRIRQEIQEEGKGLFVAYAGDTGAKALIEAYYPEDLRPAYIATHLNDTMKYEVGMGRLTVINANLFNWIGEIDPRTLKEIQRNNRNARRELRRSHSQVDHNLDFARDLAAKEKKAYDRFEDFYTNAMIDTHKFGMAKVHVSQHTPRGRR